MKYALTEVVYSQYIQYEDGPGSLSNICSRQSREKIVWQGYSTEHPPSRETLEDWLRWDWREIMENDSPDGFEEFNYTLKYREGESDSWQFLSNIDNKGCFLKKFK